MIYIVGRVKDQVVLETVDIVPDPDLESYKENIVSNYGGTKDDYFIINISKESPDYDSVIKREVTLDISDSKIVGMVLEEPMLVSLEEEELL